MDDPYRPVPKGTYGEVKYVDDIGTIHTSWENGQGLGVTLEDDCKKLLYYTAEEFIDIFGGGDLYSVRSGENIYIFSQYRFGEADFDFGIYGKISVDEAKKGGIDEFSLIPDIFLDERDDLDTVYPKTKPTDEIKSEKGNNTEVVYIKEYNLRYEGEKEAV
jgi:hypothetical protein